MDGTRVATWRGLLGSVVTTRPTVMRWVSVGALVVGFSCVLCSLLGSWATAGNLSSISLARAVALAGSDAVNAPAPVNAVTFGVAAAVLLGAVTAGLGGRVLCGVRLVLGVALAVGINRLASSRAVGAGIGLGIGLAMAGVALVIVGSVLGLLTTAQLERREIAWAPAGVGLLVGVGVVIAVLAAPGLGADDPAAARDGLTVSLQSGDVYGAATYLFPGDLVDEGAIALGVDAVLGIVGIEPLSPDAAPGRITRTAIGLAVRLLPTGEVDGRTYVRISADAG